MNPITPGPDLNLIDAIAAIVANPEEAKRRSKEMAQHRATVAATLDDTRATLQKIEKQRAEAAEKARASLERKRALIDAA